MTYLEYRALEYPSHAHCPHECEHPQPIDYDGLAVCGRCLIQDREVVPMVLCTPETCED